MSDNPFKIKQNTVRDNRLTDYSRIANEGDNLLFMPTFVSWLGKNLKVKSAFIFYVVLATLFVTLFGRAFYLQVVAGSRYRQLADRNRIKVVALKAPRGILYDRYGKPLVSNVSKFFLYLNPRLIQSKEQAQKIREDLVALLPDATERVNAFVDAYQTTEVVTLIAEDVPYETALRLIIESSDVAAIQIAYEPRREYVSTGGLGHIVGYTGKPSDADLLTLKGYDGSDIVGKSGIEKNYEQLLRGIDGMVQIEVDAKGREKNQLTRTPPIRGSDITLTIDSDMQNKLFAIMSDISRQNNNTPASAVVVDPTNGDILALVSVPAFDPNLFTSQLKTDEYAKIVNDRARPLFDRVIGGSYPAGSVFKMVLAGAALQEELIDDKFSVVSTGGLQLGNRFFPDWRPQGHGITTIYWALADSVNTFFYTIGGGYGSRPGLGVDLINRYAQRFGFGKVTGIDVPGESAGFVPTRAWKESQGEAWYLGDTYNLSIGQGSLLVSPLQIAAYASYFANNGSLVRPHLLLQYQPNDGSPMVHYDHVVLDKDIISSSNTAIIRKALRQTILTGTAKSMQSVKVPVAGKTGTAQFNTRKSPHSWFTGFAPYDKPQLEITTMVEEGGDHGLAIVAAREFLEWEFNTRPATP